MSPYRALARPEDPSPPRRRLRAVPARLPGGIWSTSQIRYLEQHLRWMQGCDRADSTITLRRRALTLLAEYLGIDPFEATLEQLEDWQFSLPTKAARRTQTSLIRPYYSWLHARGYRLDNPAAVLPMPRKPKRLPQPIAEGDLMKAITTAPQRELPWLLLAGWTGMRASDIAVMRRDRIHTSIVGDRYARVVGKGGVERDVAIPDWVWQRIEPLMYSDGWCWRRERGPGKGVEPRTAQHISQFCNGYLHKVVGTASTLHKLRARVGTRTLEDTRNARTVQAVLGHANVSQIEDYAAVAGQDKSEAVERLPRPPGAPVREPSRRGGGGVRAMDLAEHEIDQLVDAWVSTYRSRHSRDAFRRDVESWRAWCPSSGVSFIRARRSDVERYRAWLETDAVTVHGRPYAPATVARRLDGLSAFYRYLVDEGYLSRNPAARVKRPKLSQQSQTPGLTRDESHTLLEHAATVGHLEFATVWVLLATGMRISELVAADVQDLDDRGTAMTLSITSKGGRPDLVAIPGAAADALREHLRTRTPSGSRGLLQRDGLRAGRRWANHMLEKLCAAAGVGRVTAHGLRHTSATLLLDAGVSVWDVQTHLRHRSVESTLRYDRARRARAGQAAVLLVDVLTTRPGDTAAA